MTVLVSPAATSSWPPALQQAPRVVVVDRQPLFSEVLRSFLSEPPMNAATTLSTNTEVAREMATRGEVDLVFCDVLAGPLTAAGLVRSLSELSPAIPVILLGELGDLQGYLPLLLDGAAGIFTKDCAPTELVVGAGATLAGHRAVSFGILAAALRSRDPERAAEGTEPPCEGPAVLSRAEREVLALLGQARSVRAIASIRGTSPKTVRNHMSSIYRKLELHNRTEATLYAARTGLAADAGAGRFGHASLATWDI